jgi:hypothetical protein
MSGIGEKETNTPGRVAGHLSTDPGEGGKVLHGLTIELRYQGLPSSRGWLSRISTLYILSDEPRRLIDRTAEKPARLGRR